MPFHSVLSIDYAIRCRQVIIRFVLTGMHRIDGRNAYAKKNYERVIMKLTTIPLSLKLLTNDDIKLIYPLIQASLIGNLQ